MTASRSSTPRLTGCVLVADGERGLLVAGSQQPNVILLDVLLPGLDGFEICGRLKPTRAPPRSRSCCSPPWTIARRGSMALRAGANDFIPGPVDDADLLLRIRNLRSPLAGVQTYLELLRLLAEERADAREQDLITQALVTLANVTEIMNTVLDVSRLEAAGKAGSLEGAELLLDAIRSESALARTRLEQEIRPTA